MEITAIMQTRGRKRKRERIIPKRNTCIMTTEDSIYFCLNLRMTEVFSFSESIRTDF